MDISSIRHGMQFSNDFDDYDNGSLLQENQQPLGDPESSIALGQDAGLIMSLRENGFDFFIDYKDL